MFEMYAVGIDRPFDATDYSMGTLFSTNIHIPKRLKPYTIDFERTFLNLSTGSISSAIVDSCLPGNLVLYTESTGRISVT